MTPLEILPAVAVIIFDEQGKILLQKRADVKRWGLISGHVEPGETVSEAAIREVREETGLAVRLKRLIGIYSDPASQTFAYPNGRTVHFVTTYFEAQVLELEPAQTAYSSETLAWRFFSPDWLPEELLPMHPNWLTDALQVEALTFVR